MVALENNLFWLLIVLAPVGAVAAFFATAGRPLAIRLGRYFVAWWERDKRAEEEARRARECRDRAEAELRDAYDPASTAPGTVAAAPSSEPSRPVAAPENDTTAAAATLPLTSKKP